jgi:hypothetical protein
LQNEALHVLCSPNRHVVRVIISRGMRWAGDVARKGDSKECVHNFCGYWMEETTRSTCFFGVTYVWKQVRGKYLDVLILKWVSSWRYCMTWNLMIQRLAGRLGFVTIAFCMAGLVM